MIWWHQAWQPLWGHANLLDRTLGWYETVEPVAREIARRQGFPGVRWMKMNRPQWYGSSLECRFFPDLATTALYLSGRTCLPCQSFG